MPNQITWLLVLAIFAAGCAVGTPMVHMERDFVPAAYQKVEILTVTNDTGQTYEFDVSEMLTKNIKSQFKDKGCLLASHQEKDSVLMVKSSLTLYEPGSAFKRGLLPGYGATRCTVKTSLIDKKTGKVIGEIVVPKTISEGGLYSIGADKRILNVVAADIAQETIKQVSVQAKEK
jgi:hypothetical protein